MLSNVDAASSRVAFERRCFACATRLEAASTFMATGFLYSLYKVPPKKLNTKAGLKEAARHLFHFNLNPVVVRFAIGMQMIGIAPGRQTKGDKDKGLTEVIGLPCCS